jgi:hypothetical protein
MPKNSCLYQTLRHDKKLGVYTPAEPQKVLTMQDPYNPTSYNIYVATLCQQKPTNRAIKILENYAIEEPKTDDYFLIEYK